MFELHCNPPRIQRSAADSIRLRREQAELDRFIALLQRLSPIMKARLEPAERNRRNLRDIFLFVYGDSPDEADADLHSRSDVRVSSLLRRWKTDVFYGGGGEFYHGLMQRIPYRGVNGEVEWRT